MPSKAVVIGVIVAVVVVVLAISGAVVAFSGVPGGGSLQNPSWRDHLQSGGSIPAGVPASNLTVGQFLVSPNGNYSCRMESDGYLYIYKGNPTNLGAQVWSNAQGRSVWWNPFKSKAMSGAYPNAYAIIQSDNNFCVYNGVPFCTTAGAASGNGPFFVQLTDGGQLQEYSGMYAGGAAPAGQTPFWSSPMPSS